MLFDGIKNCNKAKNAINLDHLAIMAEFCTVCEISKGRRNLVFSNPPNKPRKLMFIGEAPGENEDILGIPFTGVSGDMLTRIITKGMKLTREDVYLANILKCRPPGNRDPTEEETQNCTPWLKRQIELVNPKVIVTLGKHSSHWMLKSKETMTRMRGRVYTVDGRKVIPTWHPAYLLRNPEKKGECWEDIQLAMKELET